MTIDKPQHGSLASEVAVVLGQALDKASKLFSFKKAMPSRQKIMSLSLSFAYLSQ
ncbi:hypothetical protein [Bartonella sp. ML70XJBT.G]|uniref:hypothetical protein n=1 Tax=Bartonella sp. ML70XJBT.G TaxID=3019093 RepID=UPI00235F82E5|nr:hypothetical protein [Bartonella sp. ML70XJBT.G]